MFKHLLVPLDGSRLAEAALPVAADLAQALGASMMLLHIIEEKPPEAVHGQPHLANADQACTYLEEAASRIRAANLRVETHVHAAQVSDVARSIAEHEGELKHDLIVMCTHGQSGLYTRLFGSIAQEVIALGSTPVLLVQPSHAHPPALFSCLRLLVPLDGNPEHEAGLLVAEELAQPCGSELHLVMVVPTLGTLRGQQAAAGRLLPGAMSTLLDLDKEAAEERLRETTAHIRTRGLRVEAEVKRGDPARVIVRTARRVRADVIVLATHGKTGIEAFWSASVAPEVSARAKAPLLLVPLRDREPQSGRRP